MSITKPPANLIKLPIFPANPTPSFPFNQPDARIATEEKRVNSETRIKKRAPHRTSLYKMSTWNDLTPRIDHYEPPGILMNVNYYTQFTPEDS